jgi:hypothetical protein
MPGYGFCTGLAPCSHQVARSNEKPKPLKKTLVGSPGQTGNATMSRNQLVEKKPDGKEPRNTHTVRLLKTEAGQQAIYC